MREPVIEIQDATVVLDDVRILDRLTFTVSAGEHAAILGPNGAGKSTLMKLLTLQLYPVAPEDGPPPIRLFGRERWDVFDLRSQIGIVSADLHDRFVHGNSNGAITGLDAVLSGFFATQGVFGHLHVTAAMRAQAEAALDTMGMAHMAGASLGTMSTGEARRVLIARALVHRPRLLVLDEPTRGLDIVAQYRFMEQVRAVARLGTTLLLVTHHIEEIVPEIERVMLLWRGTLAFDGPKAEALTADRLSRTFGAPLEVTSAGGYFHVRTND